MDTLGHTVIEVQNLLRTFGNVVAVAGVSFRVQAGEIFAFLGPNGAGKTTTLQMLITLLRPTSGTVRVDGRNPVTDPLGVRRSFGVVFQDTSLDAELTAFENMDLHGIFYHLPRRVSEGRINELLTLFGLWDRRHTMVKVFSGGMRRRLEVARALLHTPKILFLDEPTLGLDPQSRNILWQRVRDLNKSEGLTVFLTTHYMDEAERIAHRVAVIDAGRIIACGSPRALCDETGTSSLERAFLVLTGASSRDRPPGAADELRELARIWRR